LLACLTVRSSQTPARLRRDCIVHRMGRHGLPKFLVLREGCAPWQRDPLTPPAQTGSSISRCRSREIIQLGESDCKARGPLLTPGCHPAMRASNCRLTTQCRGCGHSHWTVSTRPLCRRRRQPTAPTASELRRDRPRCRTAQSQQAVPGQQMGRGASVDRPGRPARTRL
jgi:hypothetical protein